MKTQTLKSRLHRLADRIDWTVEVEGLGDPLDLDAVSEILRALAGGTCADTIADQFDWQDSEPEDEPEEDEAEAEETEESDV